MYCRCEEAGCTTYDVISNISQKASRRLLGIVEEKPSFDKFWFGFRDFSVVTKNICSLILVHLSCILGALTLGNLYPT